MSPSPATPPPLSAAALPVGGRMTLKARLQRSPAWAFVLYVSVTSFVVYASMYGFRKAFTAASYDGVQFLHISYKVVLVISQVMGYCLSKFYGIKFIAGMRPEKRAWFIVVLIVTGWLSLLLFGLVPAPYNFFFMFVNGLPLGMVWGLVFSFVEGRRVTELMGAVLATSFVFASGLAKTVGKMLLLKGVDAFWMPFVAGAVFMAPALMSPGLWNKPPPPPAEDVAQRPTRKPMDKEERRGFLRRFGVALIPIVSAYVMLTILRDFTEDFANELWTETGYKNVADVFARTSTIVSLIVLAAIGGVFLVRTNYRTFCI